jgi:hypothetical protein
MGNHVSQSTNQSLWYVNAAGTVPSLFSPLLSPRRTKMFGRVIATHRYETLISLLNPSSDTHYGTASRTEIQVFSASGRDRVVAQVSVPPHGCVWTSVEALIPGLVEFLESSKGVSTLAVIDPDVKLTGYLGVRDRTHGTVAIDHLFGG